MPCRVRILVYPQARCSPRTIITLPHFGGSRDFANQAFPFSACNIEKWVWPGDEAMYVCVCVYNYVSVGMVRSKIVGYAYAERAPTTNKITIMCVYGYMWNEYVHVYM